MKTSGEQWGSDSRNKHYRMENKACPYYIKKI